MKKIRILIAEDHKLLRETWTTLLNNDPRFVVVAACSDTEEAVLRARLELPDIILMDIKIIPFDGFQATARLREVSPDSKTIGLSLFTELKYVQKMFAAGARGYMTKNSAREEMYEAIVKVHNGKCYVCSEIRGKGFQISSISTLNSIGFEFEPPRIIRA